MNMFTSLSSFPGFNQPPIVQGYHFSQPSLFACSTTSQVITPDSPVTGGIKSAICGCCTAYKGPGKSRNFPELVSEPGPELLYTRAGTIPELVSELPEQGRNFCTELKEIHRGAL